MFFTGRSELLPFVRFESFSFTAPSGTAASDETDEHHSVVTGGIAFKPLENLILKTDYRWTNSDEVPEKGQFSLGMGYSY